MIGRTVTIDGQEHTLVAIHYRQESAQATAGHVLLLANGESGQFVEHPVGTQPWSQAFMKPSTGAPSSATQAIRTSLDDVAKMHGWVGSRTTSGPVAVQPDAPLIVSDELLEEISRNGHGDQEEFIAIVSELKRRRAADETEPASTPRVGGFSIHEMPDRYLMLVGTKAAISQADIERHQAVCIDGRVVKNAWGACGHVASVIGPDLADSLRARIVDLEDQLARSTKKADLLWSAIRPAMPDNGDGRYPPSASGVENALRDGRILTDTGARRTHQAEADLRICKAELERAERLYKAMHDAIVVVMPADGNGRYPATAAGFSNAVMDGRIVAYPDRKLEQAIYERNLARSAFEQVSAERDQARAEHATASESLAAALADASVERDRMVEQIAFRDELTRKLRVAMGAQQHENLHDVVRRLVVSDGMRSGPLNGYARTSENDVAAVARMREELRAMTETATVRSEQTVRIRSDLAATMSAHLDDKQVIRDLTAELESVRSNVAHAVGSSGDASTGALVAVLIEDQQKLRKSTVDLTSEVAKLTETRRVYEHMIQGIGEVLPVGSPIDVRKAVVQMAAERTAARDELVAIRGLVTKALDHDTRHDTGGLAAKALVSMLVNQYTDLTGHLAWIRARVAHVLGQHGPESTSDKVAMLANQFVAVETQQAASRGELAAIRATSIRALEYAGSGSPTADLVSMLADQLDAATEVVDEYRKFKASLVPNADGPLLSVTINAEGQLLQDGVPIDKRVVAIGLGGLPVSVEPISLSDDLERVGNGPDHVVSRMAQELRFRRIQVSEAFDARASIARALGVVSNVNAWPLIVKKADAVRSCRDELVDTIAELRAEAKRSRESAEAKRLRDQVATARSACSMYSASTMVPVPLSTPRQETPWRPVDADGSSDT